MRKYIIIGLTAVSICLLLLLPVFKHTARSVFFFPSCVISSASQGVQNFFSFLIHVRNVDAENIKLRESLNEMNTKSVLYEAKIRDLENMVSYRQLSSNVLTSRIIERDPASWFKMVSVDKGSAEGIGSDMPVLLPQGIVGRTADISPDYSTVILAIDRSSKISALVDQTREVGMVEGTGSSMIIKFFSRDIDARPGDDIFTSGLGGIFPKGLNIGRITSINTKGLVAAADIKPGVEFNKLEHVHILLKR